MQERLHARQSSDLALGQSVLFFGCRQADQDYLYGQQLEQWAEHGSLTLFTAFSRQQVRTHCPSQAVPVCKHNPKPHPYCVILDQGNSRASWGQGGLDSEKSGVCTLALCVLGRYIGVSCMYA